MISEFVEYVKQVWKNNPNVSSPLNADRLNHMEAGIENNSKKIKETVTAVNELTEKVIILNDESTGAVKLLNGTATSFGGTNKVVKKGKLVTLDLALNLDNAAMTTFQVSSIGQLPAGFEPLSAVTSQTITRANGFYLMEVNTVGTINVQPFNEKASSLNACILHLTWIAKK